MKPIALPKPLPISDAPMVQDVSRRPTQPWREYYESLALAVKALITGLGTGAVTVAELPDAARVGAGARAFVTDADDTTFLSVVNGGGSNAVPVVSNDTDWLIG